MHQHSEFYSLVCLYLVELYEINVEKKICSCDYGHSVLRVEDAQTAVDVSPWLVGLGHCMNCR